MFEKAKNLVSRFFWGPVRDNTALTVLVLGSVLFLIGALGSDNLSSPESLYDKLILLLKDAGSILVGAGVFAVILKSVQFSTLFQEHVADVFYNPGIVEDTETRKRRWKTLTDSILQETLPQSHAKATKEIMGYYFTEELEYHYKNLVILYDIKVEDDNDTLNVTQTIKADLIIPSYHHSPVIRQSFEVNGDSALDYIKVAQDVLTTPEQLERYLQILDPRYPNKKEFQFPLIKNHISINAENDRYVPFVRVIRFKQSLREEPYFLNTIIRYVKGLEVRAKTNKGNLIFRQSGFIFNRTIHGQPSEDQSVCWKMAGPEELLLPGNGYILILSVPAG